MLGWLRAHRVKPVGFLRQLGRTQRGAGKGRGATAWPAARGLPGITRATLSGISSVARGGRAGRPANSDTADPACLAHSQPGAPAAAARRLRRSCLALFPIAYCRGACHRHRCCLSSRCVGMNRTDPIFAAAPRPRNRRTAQGRGSRRHQSVHRDGLDQAGIVSVCGPRSSSSTASTGWRVISLRAEQSGASAPFISPIGYSSISAGADFSAATTTAVTKPIWTISSTRPALG